MASLFKLPNNPNSPNNPNNPTIVSFLKSTQQPQMLVKVFDNKSEFTFNCIALEVYPPVK